MHLLYTALFLLGTSILAPQMAHAQTQCTTADLDLECPSGHVLTGIKSNGTKKCLDLDKKLSESITGLTECRVCIEKIGDSGDTEHNGQWCSNWAGAGEKSMTQNVIDFSGGGKHEAIGIECR